MSFPFLQHFISSQFASLPPLPDQSLTGKTVIVTGSNTGLGFEAARHYSTLGASLIILAVRDIKKGEDARSRLLTGANGDQKIEVWALDMSDNASIISFSQKAASLPRIDIFLANAGVMQHHWQTIPSTGWEITMAVNFYGTILLSLLMIPILRSTGKEHASRANLTVVTSEVHHFTSWGRAGQSLAELDDENKFVPTDRYNITKLLEVLYIRELVKSLGSADANGPVITLANPGMCQSEFFRNISGLKRKAMGIGSALMARRTEEGAKTLVWATLAGEEGNGRYSLDCTFSEKAVSRFVRSEDGREMQRRVFGEANERVERVAPGVLKKALDG